MITKDNELNQNNEKIASDFCKLKSLIQILVAAIYMEEEVEINIGDTQILSNVILNEVIKINENIEKITVNL